MTAASGDPMDDTTASTGPSRPSRRTIARGAAWSVPVIAVGAASPAFAASHTVSVQTSATCATRDGTFAITVSGLAAGEQVNISLVGNNSGTSPGTSNVTGSGLNYALTGDGSTSTLGRIFVSGPSFNGQGSSTVTATVTGSGGVSVTGDLTATITFSRSGQYTCTGSA